MKKLVNKYIIVLFLLLTGIVKSYSQSPESILVEMRNIDGISLSYEEYFGELLTYYDEPSRITLNEYMKESAKEWGMSLDKYYSFLDGMKNSLSGIGFDMFSNLLSKTGNNRCGFSKFSQYRSIDEENHIQITESVNFNIKEYLYCLKNNYPEIFGFLDESAMNAMEETFQESLPSDMYSDGKLYNNTVFVRENGNWKIHLTKDQVNLFFPGNNHPEDFQPVPNNQPDKSEDNKKKIIELKINSVSIDYFDDMDGDGYYSSASVEIDFEINDITDYSDGGEFYQEMMKKISNISLSCKYRLLYKTHNENAYLSYIKSIAFYQKNNQNSYLSESIIGYPNNELKHNKYDIKIEFYIEKDNQLLAIASCDLYPELFSIKLETLEQDNEKEPDGEIEPEEKDSDDKNPGDIPKNNPNKKELEKLLAKANNEMVSGNLKEAGDLYSKVVKKDKNKNYEFAYINGAECYYYAKKYKKVVELLELYEYNNLNDNESFKPKYRYLMGMSLFRQKQPKYERAKWYLEKALDLDITDKNRKRVSFVIANCFENMGNFDSALDAYIDFVEDYPEEKNKLKERIKNIAYKNIAVEVYYSSNNTEGYLTGYHDRQNQYHSQITVQVFNTKAYYFFEGCKISISFINPINNEILFIDNSFKEINKGCYSLVLNEKNNLVVFTKIGSIYANIKIEINGYGSIKRGITFRNIDPKRGCLMPPDGYWFHPLNYGSGNKKEIEVVVDRKKYRTIDVFSKNFHNKQHLLIPYKVFDGKVPSNWDVYSKVLKAEVIKSNFYISQEKLKFYIDNLNKLKKFLKIMKISSESIELLVPVLNALVLGGATTTIAVPKITGIVTKQVAEYMLSESLMPNEQFDDYIYRLALNKIRFSTERLQSVVELNKKNFQNQLINEDELVKMYHDFKDALISSNIAVEITKSFLLDKSIWKKLMEEELKTLSGNVLPYSEKVYSLINFINNELPELSSSLKVVNKLENHFYNNYEINWNENGAAKEMFNIFRNKKIKNPELLAPPEVSNFVQKYINEKYHITWTISKAYSSDNISYTIKYNNNHITPNNWMNSKFLYQSYKISNEDGMCHLVTTKMPAGLHFAIKSQICTGYCSKIIQNL